MNSNAPEAGCAADRQTHPNNMQGRVRDLTQAVMRLEDLYATLAGHDSDLTDKALTQVEPGLTVKEVMQNVPESLGMLTDRINMTIESIQHDLI